MGKDILILERIPLDPKFRRGLKEKLDCEVGKAAFIEEAKEEIGTGKYGFLVLAYPFDHYSEAEQTKPFLKYVRSKGMKVVVFSNYPESTIKDNYTPDKHYDACLCGKDRTPPSEADLVSVIQHLQSTK